MQTSILINPDKQVNNLFFKKFGDLKNHGGSRKKLLERSISNSNLDNKELLNYLVFSCEVLTREEIDKIGNVLVENSKQGIKESVYGVCEKAEISHIPRYSYNNLSQNRIKAKDVYLDHLCFSYDLPDKPLEFTPDKIPPSVFDISNQNNPYRSLVGDLGKLASGNIGIEYGDNYQENYYISSKGVGDSRIMWLYFTFYFKPYLTKDDLIVAGNGFNEPYLTKNFLRNKS